MRLPILLVEPGEIIRTLSVNYRVLSVTRRGNRVTVEVTNGSPVVKILYFDDDDYVNVIAE